VKYFSVEAWFYGMLIAFAIATAILFYTFIRDVRKTKKKADK
jgi:hypothetical protein